MSSHAMIRYVHKISPRDTDVEGPFPVREQDFASLKNAKAWLQRNGQEHRLGRAEWRVEADRVVVFPGDGGFRNINIWHSLIITFCDAPTTSASCETTSYGETA